MPRFLIAVVLFLGLATWAEATTITAADCSTASVQTAITTAVNGDTVIVPSGTCTWTSGISVTKAITIQGAGSGRIIAQSTSTVVLGTGAKTWTTQSGLPITTGQTLHVYRLGDRPQFMEGTVTSYSGTTLTMNITSSGTSSPNSSCNGLACPPNLWVIATMPSTTIINNSSTTLFSFIESTAGSINWSQIKLAVGTGSGDHLSISRTTGGFPVLIHDCWSESTSHSGNMIYSTSNQGVVWNCTFDASPWSGAPLAIHHKDGPPDSWTTPALWGALDTTGTTAWYVETSDFHAWLNAVDNDDNGRIVFRYNLMNNAGFGTHGADTSPYGERYFEAYNNTFVFNGYSNGTTFNLNWWFFIRGGSAVIHDNVMPNILSQDTGNKFGINFIVINLRRNAGPHPCWGNGTTGGALYPAPRQVGLGRVTGTGSSDSFTYNGDSEPIYIWNNTGGYVVGISDDNPPSCSAPDVSANYIISGRDYFPATAKPNYTPFVYPHPLTISGIPALQLQGGALQLCGSALCLR